jgi:all-trans-retinol 13,14-reductase
METNSQYDAIVIGGGWSGLISGITAAKRGKKVLLLEKHTTVGGLAAGFKRKSYTFDSGMSRCMPYIQPRLHQAGVHPRLVPQRCIWNVGGCWVDYSSLESLIKGLENVFPEERVGLRNLYENEIRPAGKFVTTIFSGLTAESIIDKALGMVRLNGAIREVKKMKSIRAMEKEVYARYLDPNGRALAFLAEKEDEVDYRGEMDLATKVGKLYTQTMNIYPYEGYQALADEMAAVIRAHGGEVRTRAEVKKILIEDGKAVGVETRTRKGSERLLAKKIVCCLDLNKAFHSLIGDAYLDARLLERLQGSRLSRPIPILYLGTAISPEKIRQAFQGREEVWFYPEIEPDPGGEHFFRTHSMVVHASCLHNPAHAPQGKTNLQVYLSCPPDGWMENWGLADGARTLQYRQIKRECIDDALDALEELIPDLRDRSLIEVCELGTPFTLERYTANMGGSCLGFRMDADALNSRERNEYFDRCPGIDGLYFAGQQTGFSGGVLSALGSGKHAGEIV